MTGRQGCRLRDTRDTANTVSASKKCMKAEGGGARIVWMPKELKEQVARDTVYGTAEELYGYRQLYRYDR